MEIGERIQTRKQLFNIKHGIQPADIRMTDRALGRPPLEKGANQGRSIPIEKMISDYWKIFEWDPQTGKPTSAAIRRLGL
jgi:aldehyde:ferredoxin oxidoreductase